MNNCLLEKENNINNNDNSIEIREARYDDVYKVVDLLEEGFEVILSPVEIRSLKYDILNGLSTVALLNNEVVGYVNGNRLDRDELYYLSAERKDVYNYLTNYINTKNKSVRDYLEIRNLVVAVKARGLHIGNLLVEDIMKRSTINNYLVVGLKQTKLNKWLAKKIFLNLNYTKLIEKDDFWYEQSLLHGFDCNLCLKELNEVCCRCSGSVWVLESEH